MLMTELADLEPEKIEEIGKWLRKIRKAGESYNLASEEVRGLKYVVVKNLLVGNYEPDDIWEIVHHEASFRDLVDPFCYAVAASAQMTGTPESEMDTTEFEAWTGQGDPDA